MEKYIPATNFVAGDAETQITVDGTNKKIKTRFAEGFESDFHAFQNQMKKHRIPVFAIKGENHKTYYAHINAVLDAKPQFTMDDGADLVSVLHTKRRELLAGVQGGTEETTTGIIRLRSMAADGVLKYPIIAVNDAWLRFGHENGAVTDSSIGIGNDYLEICRPAAEQGLDNADKMYEGIQAVLEGRQQTFEIEYPCHSPTEEQWYLMSSMPLKGEKKGVVV